MAMVCSLHVIFTSRHLASFHELSLQPSLLLGKQSGAGILLPEDESTSESMTLWCFARVNHLKIIEKSLEIIENHGAPSPGLALTAQSWPRIAV